MVGCEAKSALSWNDPMPVVRSTLYRLTAGRVTEGHVTEGHVTEGLGEKKPAQPRAWRRSGL
jgi:hypothetical protein